MRSHTLLMSAALLPLAACFEVVIPEEPEPEPAELQEGEWIFDMEMVAVDGDCWAMGIDVDDAYLYEYSAWAWIETHGERDVSIDLEGFLLDGRIDGESLYADGELAYGYDYGDEGEPVPLEDEDDWGDEDGDHSDDEPGYDPSSGSDGAPGADCPSGDGDAEILPICEDIEPYPEEEFIFASLDADILSPERMRGSILVDYVYFDTYCSIEFAFEAEALDEDPCDCDCCCDDDPAPYTGDTEEPSEGSVGGSPA